MGGVDDEHVCAGADERLRALERVGTDADRGADAEPPVRVLRRLGEIDALLDVLDGDQAGDAPFTVDDRELLDAVAVQQLLRFAERRADRRRHQVARGHQRGHRLGVFFSKRRSRFVRMPTRRPSASVIGTPET